jgi:phosphoserine phosphatase RsbU/P
MPAGDKVGRVNFDVSVATGGADPGDVPGMLVAAVSELGATNLVVYLVDFEQRLLEPIRDQSAPSALAETEEVGVSVAGRAFVERQAQVVERDDGTRVWVPIIEGSDPTGVLALTIPAVNDEAIRACQELGVLAGYLIATHARVTDLYNLHRRRRSMTLAASMQWDLLPPLAVQTNRVAAAGMIEPAYEVGGDCFDYALNGPNFDFAIMDSMGHGVRSAVVAGLAIGAYRHGRRQGQSLEHIHQALDGVIRDECGGDGFVTGQLGRLELGSGSLAILNAGHPPPLLIRHGRVIQKLDCPPAPPWGIGSERAQRTVVSLEPGDSVLLYSDGVVEGRGRPYSDFGVERLQDLAGRHFSDQVPLGLIVRLLTEAVLTYHGGRLHDDATVFVVNWPGPTG